jgi:hypothetical protein
MSEKPKKNLDEVFEALDKAGMSEVDLLADRDRSLPQERNLLDDDWNPADYDDEPRSGGNFGLDVQQQEAAESARRGEKKP